MTGGFYLMHRGWRENPVFAGEPYSRADAWIWLIENAAFAPHEIGVKGKTVTIERGQLSHSLRHMAGVWKWDEAKVRRFLSRLEAEGMISRCVAAASLLRRCSKTNAQGDAAQTVISICNYDTYQKNTETSDEANDAASTQHRRSSDAIYKQGKERNEGNDLSYAPARKLDTISKIETRMEFDGEFWPLCPHQTGKTDAYAAFHEARQSASLSDICDGMRRYAETLKRPKAPQPMNPANWLQKQRWTDKPMEPTNAADSINPLTVRGAAAWVVAGELTRGAFEQPGEARPSYGGSYGGSLEAPCFDGTAYPDGSA